MNNIVKVNDSNFETEVSLSSGLVLVEMSAIWCGPCKRQQPILEQLALDVPNLKIVLVDIDDSPVISAKLSIRSVPTLILFKDGQKVKTLVGLQSLAALKAML